MNLKLYILTSVISFLLSASGLIVILIAQINKTHFVVQAIGLLMVIIGVAINLLNKKLIKK